ncbi:MAG: nucleoside-diphosphate kinase [Candidatus Peregrinibacteria bacterium]
MNTLQKTLVFLKPDTVQRGLVGNILTRLENKGLKLVAMKMLALKDEVLHEHYAHVAGRDFFPPMKRFLKSTPVIVMIWEGIDAISVVRKLVGSTNAREADIGTIRGDLAMSGQFNMIHASDSEESATQEITRFFLPEEIFKYEKSEYLHIYSEGERKTF